MDKKITSIFIKSVLNRFMRIENLYLKFILTVIAGALIVIATELSDKNLYVSADIFHGSIGIDGTVKVSGEVDTYEQNTIIGRKLNHYNP